MPARVFEFVTRLFPVKAGERRRVWGIAAYGFLVVTALIIGRVTRDTLFLSHTKGGAVAWMYVVSAAVVSPLSVAYAARAGAFRLDAVMRACLAFFAAWFAASRVAYAVLPDAAAPWLAGALYVVVELMAAILMVQLFSFAQEVFDARQSKRLASLVNLGPVAANLVALPMRSINDRLAGPADLLWVVAGLLAAAAVLIHRLGALSRTELESELLKRRRRPTLHPGRSDEPARPEVPHYETTLRRRIALLVLVGVGTVTILDYQFKIAARAAFEGRALADMLLAVYGWGGILAVGMQLVAGRVLERFNIVGMLLPLPVVLCASSVLTALDGPEFVIISSMGGVVFAGLGFAPARPVPGVFGLTLGKTADTLLRYTFSDPTMKLLYRPLSPRRRNAVQAFDAGVLRPVAQAALGSAMIVLAAGTHIDAPDRVHLLAWGVAGATVVWLMLVMRAFRAYERAVEALIRRRGLADDDDGAAVRSPAGRRALLTALTGPDAGAAAAALELAAGLRLNDFTDAARDRLNHPDGALRAAALAYLAAVDAPLPRDALAAATRDPHPAVAARAIRMVGALYGADAPEVRAALDRSDLPARAAAVSMIARAAGAPNLRVQAEIARMLAEPDPASRAQAARLLPRVRDPEALAALRQLAADPNAMVRRAAIEAAGACGVDAPFDMLFAALDDPPVRKAAVQGLAATGALFFAEAEQRLAAGPTGAVRDAIVEAVSRTPDSRAVPMLLREWARTPPGRRAVLVAGYRRLRARPETPALPAAFIRSAVADCARDARAFRSDAVAAAAIDPRSLLALVLRERAEADIRAALGLTALIYPPDVVDAVLDRLAGGDAGLRAAAVEALDNLLDRDLRGLLVPLVESRTTETDLPAYVPAAVDSIVARALAGDDAWLATAAVEWLRARHDTRHAAVVQGLAQHAADPVLRESARAATAAAAVAR